MDWFSYDDRLDAEKLDSWDASCILDKSLRASSLPHRMTILTVSSNAAYLFFSFFLSFGYSHPKKVLNGH